MNIYARIRPPGVSDMYAQTSELSSSTRAQNINENQSTLSKPTSGQTKPSSLRIEKPTALIQNASSLDKDYKCCIFTSSSKEKSQYVAISGNPIKKQLLDEYVKTDRNIIQYRNSILENASIYKFDQSFGFKATNSQICKDICDDQIKQALSLGLSSTFMIIGPAKLYLGKNTQ
ncbi:kinesin motor domain protein [Ichthyophthirius multifiliis]|uniref:Kinesin motor domain protein n=1 Tax=Ichthyophthirius multifiliis TaxID=5932 RepID=G0QIV4_ICHMU|nr:kinesin motor domain protein [Ichthyophthirius multifiliis]EGR34839.1 kinesin motor domain protein [Ichthyophthirius multifiliis]|eukprot:XP_004040143.1 kinesin motor domain protein [Ichthyophthirius multifiliis]